MLASVAASGCQWMDRLPSMNRKPINGAERAIARRLRPRSVSDAAQMGLHAAGTPSDSAQTLSDTDQTLSDTDQSLSDADQTESSTDQGSSDRDQRASDSDQAASDRDRADGLARTAAQQNEYDTTRRARAEGTFERLETRKDRGHTADGRDVTAAERDRIADTRDELGRERDRRGRARDARAADVSHTVSARKASIIQQLDELGARAASDRAAAAADRARAAKDRAAAGRERSILESELRAAHMDELTGTFRREMGRLALSHEIDRARRSDGRLVLAFIDVDGLKAVNDRHGHAAGDQLLKTVVQAIRSNIRSFDTIIRYGGDEFVCALGGIDLREAQRRFRSVQSAIEAEGVPGMRVGISVGMAALAEGEDLDELTTRADVAMLAVKAQHRSLHLGRAALL
jgi:diguanylate cyclase (GGDEF)-like protein